MKTKIEIKDSNGLRKAECVLNKIKHLPYYNRIPARTKAWLKVKNAVDNYDEVLIKNQLESHQSFFNYEVPEPKRTEASRLNEGFAMMNQDD